MVVALFTGGYFPNDLSEDEIRMISSSSSAESSVRIDVASATTVTGRSGGGVGGGGRAGSSSDTGQWMDCSDALDLLDNIQTPLLQAKTLLSDAALQSLELQRDITAVLRSSMIGQTQVHVAVLHMDTSFFHSHIVQ